MSFSGVNLARLAEIAKILEVEPNTILNFDEKQIFNFHNSHQNTVGNREAHVHYNDKVIEVLEKDNAHLRNENTRLINFIVNIRATE